MKTKVFPFKGILRKILRYLLYLYRPKIFGRTACLGRDLFDLKYKFGKKPLLINKQKVRVDLHMDWIRGHTRPRADIVKKYILRDDIHPLIDQQAEYHWDNRSNIKYFIMDSFSELTDQKFTHKEEGWSFCAHHSDINHESDFSEKFQKNGLLTIQKIEVGYELFFNWFENSFPGKSLYYFHFPTNLDNRQVFRDRGAEILKIMQGFEHKKSFIKNIFIDEKFSFGDESDPFPYHFHEKTYKLFLAEWNKKHCCD
tara:strand:+ start:1476 stop:2240 length:765 start_codon:yes stop_codon:yes gene_type:complete